MDCPPDIEFSDPTRHDDTKLDEQDFDDIEVLFHKPYVDSDEEVPPLPPYRGKLYAVIKTITSSSEISTKDCCN